MAPKKNSKKSTMVVDASFVQQHCPAYWRFRSNCVSSTAMAPKKTSKKSTMVVDGEVSVEHKEPVADDKDVAVGEELAVEVPVQKKRRTKPVTFEANDVATVGDAAEGDVVEESVATKEVKPKKRLKRNSGSNVSAAAEGEATPQTNRKLDMDAALSEPKQAAPPKIAKTTVKKPALKQTLPTTLPPTTIVPPPTALPTSVGSEATTLPASLEDLAALGLGGLPLPASTPSLGSASRAAQNEIKNMSIDKIMQTFNVPKNEALALIYAVDGLPIPDHLGEPQSPAISSVDAGSAFSTWPGSFNHT